MTAAGDADRAAGVGPGTPLQLPVHPSLVDLYRGDDAVPGRFEPSRMSGLCVRVVDVAPGPAASVRAAHGLTGWPTTGPVHVIRFAVLRPELVRTAYGATTADGAARTGRDLVLPAPFLGTGYTAGGLPEYLLDLTEIPVGAELWRIDDGAEQRVAAYGGRAVGWSGRPASPAPGAVRRGVVARHRGVDIDADLGPTAGRVTLYPDGAEPVVVADSDLDGLARLRTLVTWRGTDFELLADDGRQAVLAQLVPDHTVATNLGLVEVDHWTWRGIVASGEVDDRRRDVAEWPIQGVFASR